MFSVVVLWRALRDFYGIAEIASGDMEAEHCSARHEWITRRLPHSNMARPVRMPVIRRKQSVYTQR